MRTGHRDEIPSRLPYSGTGISENRGRDYWYPVIQDPCTVPQEAIA